MALSSSGALSLNDIQGEWGGSNPIGMSEYYGDGDYVTDGATDGDGNAIPESGALDISDFYDNHIEEIKDNLEIEQGNIQEAIDEAIIKFNLED